MKREHHDDRSEGNMRPALAAQPLFALPLLFMLAFLSSVLLPAGEVMAQGVSASAYPARPVRLIVAVPPGGLQDTLARAMALELGRSWNQSVVVENRVGANGIIAADLAAKAPADGYTVLQVDSVSHMTNPLLRSKLPYDPVRDFTPVIALVHVGNILVAHNELPAKNLQELIELARAKPGQLNYGSFGLGSSPHIDTEALSRAAGIQVTHIPYKGGPAVLQGLMGGEVAFSLTGLTPALPLIRQGRVRALAYGGLQRSTVLPDVPTLSESGLKGFDSSAWFGWIAPAGTPRAIVERIAADAGQVITQPEFRDKYIASLGQEVLNLQTGRFGELLASERDKFAARLKPLNLKLE
jgi:tripartite-type tricarboxylate transporter receptor subunit TctC